MTKNDVTRAAWALLILSTSATWGLGVCSGQDAAADRTWVRTAVGVTRAGTSIPAWVAPSLYDLNSARTRIVVLGDDPRIAAWLQTHLAGDTVLLTDAAGSASLSFIPDTYPDRAEGEQLGEGFPPEEEAYRSESNPEAQYVWRWLGIHGPDLVVVLRSGEEKSLVGPAGVAEALGGITVRPGSERHASGLVQQLSRQPVAEVGSIPACEITLPGTDLESHLARLLVDLSGVTLDPSSARETLQTRLRRSPRQVARQLSGHYGKSLPQVVYIPSLALMARLRLGELDQDPKHAEAVATVVEPYVAGTEDCRPTSGSGLSGHLVFCELAEGAKGERRERLIELARQAADLAWQPSPSGQLELRVPMPFHHEMSDSLFMGGPILAWTGELTGEARYFDACFEHLKRMRQWVARPDHLYRHSPLDEAAWGRGNGFPVLGLAMCLERFPEDDPRRDTMVRWFQEHCTALLKHQDADGTWHQVVDRPESYRELTSTCMITWGLIRGVRRGWLQREECEPAIARAWEAILVRTPANGRLVDVCTGTGKQKSLRDYYDRKAILGRDDRGGAMAMLVAVELAIWQAEQGRAEQGGAEQGASGAGD